MVNYLTNKMTGIRRSLHNGSHPLCGIEKRTGERAQAGRISVNKQAGMIQADGLLGAQEQGWEVVPG